MIQGNEILNSVKIDQQAYLQQNIIKHWTFEVVKMLHIDFDSKITNGNKFTLLEPDFTRLNEILSILDRTFHNIKLDPIIYVVGLFYFDYLLSTISIKESEFELYLILCVSLGSKSLKF
jgi:hypothetical protein